MSREELQVDRVERELDQTEMQWDPDLRHAITLGIEVEAFMAASPVGKHIFNKAMEDLAHVNSVMLNATRLDTPEVEEAHLKARAVNTLLDWLNEALSAAKSAQIQLESEHVEAGITEEGGIPSED